MYDTDLDEVLEIFNTSSTTDGFYAALGIFFLVILFIALISLAFKIISRWIFFKKCGEEGWKAIIPIYTDITLLKVADLNWWWILILYAGAIISSINSFSEVAQNVNGYNSAIAMFGILFALLSFAGAIGSLIAKINISYNLSKKFNKSTGYTVLILFFQSIMFLVLGLTKSCKYDKSVEVSNNGIFKN